MTGFASTSREFPGGLLAMELRAVNHRYLDVQLRLPEELRVIEPQLREQIAAAVSRGKLECRVTLAQSGSDAPRMELNPLVLDSLLDVVAQLKARLPGAKDLGTGELLRWPGVLNSNSLQPEALQQLCLGQLSALLADFNATRAREGEKLADILRSRITAIETIVGRRSPETRICPVRAKNRRGRRVVPPGGASVRGQAHPQARRPGRQAAGFPDAGAQPRSQHPGLKIGVYRNHPGFG